MVEGDRRCRDEYIGHTLRGCIADVANTQKEISTEQILEAENVLKLVLVEGAPGIGKSTFAWDRSSCARSGRSFLACSSTAWSFY